MAKYGTKLQEEEIKNLVAEDWFGAYDTTRIIGKIDFCVNVPVTELGLYDAVCGMWAEAKSGTGKDIIESFVQLILTIGKSKINDEEMPPMFLGAFDAEKIAFLPYNAVMDVFAQNDFNWNVTPSNHNTKEFKQLYALAKQTIADNSLLFRYDKDETELRKFIKSNFVPGRKDVSRIQITRNNFTHVYRKWTKAVLPSLDVPDWKALRKDGIIDADFFLADILSDKDNRTIRKKLYVLLNSDAYEVKYGKATNGLDLVSRIGFNDGQQAHRQFWNHYTRPPKREYWDFIVERRDLLVDQDVRERKGAFFTPQEWVALSQEYLAKELGDDWQDEYVVWDCCAGTGNMEAGLTNKYNVWASTLDKADVDVMHTRIKMMNEQVADGANLLDTHVFQFDFLNDSFDKLPKGLKDVVDDPEKRKKLVVYINPPYAEGDNRKGRGRRISSENHVTRTYGAEIGYGKRELFVQFLARIYKELRGCVIGEFSTPKILQAPKLREMRTMFDAKLARMFMVPACTFDNVNGKFPIGFKVWRTDVARKDNIWPEADIYDGDGVYLGKKFLVCYDSTPLINDWVATFGNNDHIEHSHGTLIAIANDFENQDSVRVCEPNRPWNHQFQWQITPENVIQSCVCMTVRTIFEHNYSNHYDQFMFPDDSWFSDGEFCGDCVVYVSFNPKNRISSSDGPNHWIPFTEAEVGAQDTFKSHFMRDFLSGKVETSAPVPKLKFSAEAKAVLSAGRKLWRYYHKQPKADPNASYYDIRKFFQGTKTTDAGKVQMNSTSDDATYNALNGALKEAMKTLAAHIAPQVYAHGFLK